jgi:prepilin-type N-terminal cleavage/methylation domain-containing protein
MKTQGKPDLRNLATPRRRRARGFTLVELLVALGVFAVISAAALRLVAAHVPLVSSQQNQTGLNMAMRNAVAQMQIDVVNAGTGYYQGVNIPTWPVGVSITNSAPGADCYNAATFTYGAGCFDTLNIIATDEATGPATPSPASGTCINTTTSNTMLLLPTGATTAAALAAAYHTGDQILLVKSDGSQMTTTLLTQDGLVSAGKVQLTHNLTAAGGVNTIALDPLGFTLAAETGKLGDQFCTGDWVLKLAPITYSVDASDNTNPKLIRTQGGARSVVSEQVIGFKVGASIWNGTTDSTYSFDTSTYNSDFALVRAVRVSVIGRTTPDYNNKFRNTFDNGPYRVEAVSVVVNPRNLSMNQ